MGCDGGEAARTSSAARAVALSGPRHRATPH